MYAFPYTIEENLGDWNYVIYKEKKVAKEVITF